MENTLKAQAIAQFFGGCPIVEVKTVPKPKVLKQHLYYPRGLVNIGNTCFLNSSLQMLNSSDSLVQLVLSGKCYGNLGQCFRDFLYMMRNDAVSSVFTPKEIHKLVREKTGKFKGYSQEDCHDFILTLLDGCAEEEKFLQKIAKEGSPYFYTTIGNAIGFYLVSKIVCMKCKTENWKFDTAFDICLPLTYSTNAQAHTSIPAISAINLPTSRNAPSGESKVSYIVHSQNNQLLTLSDYFMMFMSVEETSMEDSNAYYCAKCAQKVGSTHQYLLYDFPDCLIITLKRFAKVNDGYTKDSKKIANESELDLSCFALGGGQ